MEAVVEIYGVHTHTHQHTHTSTYTYEREKNVCVKLSSNF